MKLYLLTNQEVKRQKYLGVTRQKSLSVYIAAQFQQLMMTNWYVVQECIKVHLFLDRSCGILGSFSKLWSFSIIYQLKSKQSQLMYYWKLSQFWKNWGSSNCFLKMNGLQYPKIFSFWDVDFECPIAPLLKKIFQCS